jgi:DNA-directed RNA polymerase subunit M/transcription elongation factor TFIIS
MEKFCTYCDALLLADYSGAELMFKCHKCQISYVATPEDALRRERIKGSKVVNYKRILNTFIDDPAAFGARVKCPKKCGNDLVKQTRPDPNMHLYNGCTKCRHIWLNGADDVDESSDKHAKK